MDNKKSDIINKRKYHHPKAVVKGKDGKVINILENNHTKEKNSEKDSNGKVTALKEVNVMNYKILDCDVIKQDGDTVYWTTQSGKNRLWSHMGKIGSKSGSHLNMS